MKKFLSIFLATSMVMSVCVATASVASAEVSSVNLPTTYGQSYTWEAEDYIDEINDGIENNSYKAKEYTTTYGVNTSTADETSRASGGSFLQSGGIQPTTEANPIKLTFPINVATTTEYELEIVTASDSTVTKNNYFKLDGEQIFRTNGTSPQTSSSGIVVTAEKLGWDHTSATNNTYYEATKLTARVTLEAGQQHTIEFEIHPRGGTGYTEAGAFMLDYIKLTSYGAPGTVNLPTGNGQYYTFEGEDYTNAVSYTDANEVKNESSTWTSPTTADTIRKSSGTGVLKGNTKNGALDATLPADKVGQLTFNLYVEKDTEYDLEVVTGGGNVLYNNNYFTLDGKTIITTNTRSSSTNVAVEVLEWSAGKQDSNDYHRAIKYTRRVLLTAGPHTLVLNIPNRNSAVKYGQFMLDYIKLTSCAPVVVPGIEISDWTNETTSVTATANYENRADDTVTLYVALYDVSGRLLNVEIASSTKATDTLSKTVNLVDKTHTAKAFLWGDNLCPIFNDPAVVTKPAQ